MAKSKHYVNNEEFYELLKQYNIENTILKEAKKTKSPDEIRMIANRVAKVKNEIGQIFVKIGTGILTKPNFINYTRDWKGEMLSDATFYMSKYIDRYDISKTNPFSYFTTIAHHAFLQYINKQNKYSDKFQPLSYIENMHVQNNQAIEDIEDGF